MRDRFQIWVDAVCEQVRFWPDRKSIARELRVHYEDHVRDLLRLGRDPEAAERALSAMGNAQEVGRALNRVHKPWLGWLWEGSRFLLLVLALLLAWKVWQNDPDTRSLTDLTWNQLIWSVPSGASHAATDYLDLWLAPGEPEVYCEPYAEAPASGETCVQVPLTPGWKPGMCFTMTWRVCITIWKLPPMDTPFPGDVVWKKASGITVSGCTAPSKTAGPAAVTGLFWPWTARPAGWRLPTPGQTGR